MTEDFFLDQIDGQQKGLKVSLRIDKQRVLDELAEERKPFDGKLYPSAMSWNMCLYEYIFTGKVNEQQKPNIKSSARKKMGEILHEEMGDVLMRTPLFYGFPNYPQWMIDKLEEKKKEGRFKNPPEYYVCHPDYPFSGWVDAPLREQGDLLIIGDFKTTNIKPEKWEEKKLKLPTIQQLTQCYIYHILTGMLKLFPRDPDGIRLIYLNNRCFDHEKIDRRFEYFELTDPIKRAKTLDLMNEGVRLVKDWKEKKESYCANPHCKKHGKTSEKVEELEDEFD